MPDKKRPGEKRDVVRSWWFARVGVQFSSDTPSRGPNQLSENGGGGEGDKRKRPGARTDPSPGQAGNYGVKGCLRTRRATATPPRDRARGRSGCLCSRRLRVRFLRKQKLRETVTSPPTKKIVSYSQKKKKKAIKSAIAQDRSLG